jgi:hypothetical protein
MTDDHSSFSATDPEPHAASPTAHLLDELALYGHRPGRDESDPRPLPEPESAQAHLDAVVDALAAMLSRTRLEDDLTDLLWSFVNLFHRKIERVERELDGNEQAQRSSQAEQDGSEVRSVELERLLEQGRGLLERRNAFEFFRDYAAELFAATTGSVWRPRAGSKVNHRALTAAVIDSRDFISAKRRAEAEVPVQRLFPPTAATKRTCREVRVGPCVTSIAGPNGMRNCTRDEGGPFGFGDQVADPLRSKAVVVSVAETSGQ